MTVLLSEFSIKYNFFYAYENAAAYVRLEQAGIAALTSSNIVLKI